MSCENSKKHENYCENCCTCHDCLDEIIDDSSDRIKELETEVKKLKWFVVKVHGESSNRIAATGHGLMDSYFRMMSDECNRILHD